MSFLPLFAMSNVDKDSLLKMESACVAFQILFSVHGHSGFMSLLSQNLEAYHLFEDLCQDIPRLVFSIRRNAIRLASPGANSSDIKMAVGIRLERLYSFINWVETILGLNIITSYILEHEGRIIS